MAKPAARDDRLITRRATPRGRTTMPAKPVALPEGCAAPRAPLHQAFIPLRPAPVHDPHLPGRDPAPNPRSRAPGIPTERSSRAFAHQAGGPAPTTGRRAEPADPRVDVPDALAALMRPESLGNGRVSVLVTHSVISPGVHGRAQRRRSRRPARSLCIAADAAPNDLYECKVDSETGRYDRSRAGQLCRLTLGSGQVPCGRGEASRRHRTRCGGAGQLSVRPRSPGGRTGMRTRSTVSPGRESMAIVPPWRSTTMRCAMSRPRPVPLPTSLVV